MFLWHVLGRVISVEARSVNAIPKISVENLDYSVSFQSPIFKKRGVQSGIVAENVYWDDQQIGQASL